MTAPGTVSDRERNGMTDRSEKISIRGVTHRFRDPRGEGEITALMDIDLAVGDREFVSIVGPSGCGKTTLLSMVAGLVKPSSGVVELNGRQVTGVSPGEVGYMFARDTLLPWRTVTGNVELALELNDHQSGGRERARELVSKVGLERFGDHYPDQLSQGMRQRVALARTLAGDPNVLLMDEPFGALDAQTRVLMQDEFLRIWEASKKTAVFVTHDLVEALALSDRVVLMSSRPGRIKAEVQVNLPRPRVVEELQTNPEFERLHQTLWGQLKEETLDQEALRS
jgi:NitT/TauT family transport system ATP-binding protein